MTETFTTDGKQVLCNGTPYADAVTPTAAETIATALNAWAKGIRHA